MSLLLKALAQINSRAPADGEPVAENAPAAPEIVADKIEAAPAAVISLDSTTSLAAEFCSEIPTQSEEARPNSAIISEAAAFPILSAIDLTLEHLSDLCQAIDADVAQPAVSVPVPKPPAASAPVQPLPPPVQPSPPPPPPVVVVKSPPVVYVPTVKIRDEIRILKESISARLPLTKHTTLVFVDGGHAQTDYSWLWAFAASVLNGSSNENSTAVGKVLIADAAGSDSGVASAFGLEAGIGLSDVLRRATPLQAAIQETFHPHIRFLPRGIDSLRADQAASLARLWAGLSQDFDLLLVASGPLSGRSIDESIALPTAAEMFLPLASGVVLCVELDGTPVEVCRKSKTILESNGVNLLGYIVHGDTAA